MSLRLVDSTDSFMEPLQPYESKAVTRLVLRWAGARTSRPQTPKSVHSVVWVSLVEKPWSVSRTFECQVLPNLYLGITHPARSRNQSFPLVAFKSTLMRPVMRRSVEYAGPAGAVPALYATPGAAARWPELRKQVAFECCGVRDGPVRWPCWLRARPSETKHGTRGLAIPSRYRR